MKNFTKALLLASATTIAMPAAVFAQDGANGSAAAENDEASSNVIIVTARKTEETLQETPVAVSVISGDFLDQTGFVQVEEVVRFVPGFDLTPTNTTRASGSKIRGISTFSFSDGFESSVATVIDGVVMGREAQGFFDFMDVEAIEIIKGPQGTLFGKNASAGVINIKTRDPEFEFGGRADVSYGSFDETRLRGSVTGPLGESVAFRLSGTLNKRDGLVNNAIPGERDLNDKDTFALRGKLLFEPSDELKIILSGDYVEEDNHCCMPVFREAGAPTPAVAFALNPGVQQLVDALAEFGVVPGPGNRDIAVFYDRILQESKAGGVSGTIEYDFGDHTLTSITAWRDWQISEFNEADGVSNSSVNDRNGTDSTAEQFSQELRLNGKFGDSVDYVAGLYYFNQTVEAFGQVDINIALPFPPFFNVRTDSDREVKTDSYAAFGEATFNLSDRLSLILGGRFTHEEISATYERIAVPIDPMFPVGPFFGPDFSGATTVEDDNFSGRIIGRYFWTENLMTYLSWSRGYKGPGIDVAVTANINALNEPGGLPVLPPEVPTLWEAGLKATLFGGDGSVNLAVYDQKVRDFQTISADSIGVTTNLSIDRLKSRGVELDTTITPSGLPGLTLSGSLTFNDIEIDRFAERPDFEGVRFRDNPRWFYSLVGDYRTALGSSDIDGFLRAEFSGQSSKNTSTERLDYTQVDAYNLLNLRVGIDAPDDSWGVTFSVENVFDKDYEHFIFGSSYRALDGVTSNQYLGQPRTWTVSLRTSF